MKQILKQAACLLLGAVMLLAGCASAGNLPQSDLGSSAPVAMGRYIEGALEVPNNNLGPCILVQPDGSLLSYNVLYNADGQVVCYTSTDGTKWEMSNVGALENIQQLEGGFADLISVASNGDILYALYRDAQYQPCLAKSSENGPLTKLTLMKGWEMPPRPPAGSEGEALPLSEMPEVLPETVAAMENGNFLIGCFDKIIRYDGEGKELQRYESGGSAFSVHKNTLFMMGKGRNSIETVNLETGETIHSVALPSTTSQNDGINYGSGGAPMDTDEAGALFYADAKGIHRLAPGGSLWETVVDGELSSLGIPSLQVGGLMQDKKGGFFVSMFDNSGVHLMHYTYSADTPSMPSTELSVFALSDNHTIRQAIGEFQRRNPDVRVMFRYGLTEDGAATADDVIRSLNAELLAGKGPDILLLDGLPIGSYIEKGILMDLSGMLDSSKLLKNIVDYYLRDGKLYSMPVRISVPVMLGSAQAVEAAKRLDTLANAAAQSPDGNFLAMNSPSGRIVQFFLTSSPAWFHGDRILDQQLLAEFLMNIKAISDACNDNAILSASAGYMNRADELGLVDEGLENLIKLSKGGLQLHMQMIDGFSQLAIPFSVKNKLENGALAPMGGQSPGVFVPHGIVGINNASKHKDLAVAFVRVLFGLSVQSTDLGDGFPVSVEAIEKNIVEFPEANMGFAIGSSEGMITSGPPAKVDLQAFYQDVLLCATTASTIDKVLLENVKNECDAFFAGEKTAEQTAAAIAERTQAYLTE